ncbi:hypothetical protein GCM10023210_43800 [Chryseobacterium ginsengisoli]|uniref:Lipoprotein n=1 Tax=Chryseobacterium ginsengisoli TaxID=363853 RepID=A0ABP9MV81_9FLAO
MIQHLLKKSKLVLVFLIVLACKEQKTEIIKEYYFQSVKVNDKLEKEIFSYKEDLKRMQAAESNNLSLFFVKRNDSIFIEIGDYKPNLKMINMLGVEVMKKDTIYLFTDKNFKESNNFYKNQFGEKIKIITSSKPTFNHYDPHYRCLYIEGNNIKIQSYNNKCR